MPVSLFSVWREKQMNICETRVIYNEMKGNIILHCIIILYMLSLAPQNILTCHTRHL